MSKPSKRKAEYNKLYKDATRIVTYVKPEVKTILAQRAIDEGISLSALTEPTLEAMANDVID